MAIIDDPDLFASVLTKEVAGATLEHASLLQRNPAFWEMLAMMADEWQADSVDDDELAAWGMLMKTGQWW